MSVRRSIRRSDALTIDALSRESNPLRTFLLQVGSPDNVCLSFHASFNSSSIINSSASTNSTMIATLIRKWLAATPSATYTSSPRILIN